jgi:transcriptional regulator with XRE-family HTH domain
MKLNEWLAREGMLQRAFAEKVGANPSTISLILSGMRNPSLDLAVRIEEATKGRVKVREWIGVNGSTASG